MRHFHALCLSALTILAALPAFAETPARAALPRWTDRPRVLLIQPVIVCDDDGSHPAAAAFPKQPVDQVYASAGLELIYLEPVRWSHGPARRGEINLDQVTAAARQGRVLSPDPRIVTLFFVSAVDGDADPLGRGWQDGNVCFVALGQARPDADPALPALVVARELGHCLGLRHAADDPAVPDDVPNLQGEGPLAERLAETGLHPSQRETVLRSPLAVERVKFLSAAESRAALVDEAWEPYITGATPDTLRFTYGMKDGQPLPKEPAELLAWAKRRHAGMAAEFTPAERTLLRRAVTRICAATDADWPMISRLPWHFVKVKRGFCGDHPHTRGMFTVLSERALKHLAMSGANAADILFHEKIHILQRLNPGRFPTLYQQYGYVPLRLAPGEVARVNHLQNPDALIPDWAAAVGERRVLITTTYQPNSSGRMEWTETYRPLEFRPDGSALIGEPLADLWDVGVWRARFPIRIGYDHPHEVFAYICNEIASCRLRRMEQEELPENEILDMTRAALPRIFRLDGD